MSIDDGELSRLQEEIARLQVMNAGLRALLTEREGRKVDEAAVASAQPAPARRSLRAGDLHRSDR